MAAVNVSQAAATFRGSPRWCQLLVTVWDTPSLFVQVTVPPGPMVTEGGMKLKPWMLTEALAGPPEDTMTVPSIVVWILQWYGYVPVLANVC